MQGRQRKISHWLHQHLGLWAGVLFVLLGITGSLLTFYPEIDALMNPGIQPATEQVGEISAQKIVETLRLAYPERTGYWRIELPMAADKTITARYYHPAETAHKKFAPIIVTIDPLTYQVTSYRYWGRYPVTWIYDLHYTLLADDFGHNIVGVIGIVMLIAILLGIALWMPKWGRVARNLKPVIRTHPVKKIYDLHMLPGIYGGIFLAVIALTGVILAYPNASKSLASTLLEFEQPMPSSRNLLTAGQPQANLDDLIARSKFIFPQAEVRWIETSGDDGREVTLRLFNGNEPSRRFPQTYLKLHPVTADVLYQRNYHQLPYGDKLWAWVHPLHNGEALGILGRVLVFILGLLPAVLMTTGLIRYRQKRKARALGKSRHSLESRSNFSLKRER